MFVRVMSRPEALLRKHERSLRALAFPENPANSERAKWNCKKRHAGPPAMNHSQQRVYDGDAKLGSKVTSESVRAGTPREQVRVSGRLCSRPSRILKSLASGTRCWAIRPKALRPNHPASNTLPSVRPFPQLPLLPDQPRLFASYPAVGPQPQRVNRKKYQY
jgi:hypothetical protein